MTKVTITRIGVGVLLALLGTAPVFAATYTVSPGQNVQSVVDGLTPGDTLVLETGDYTGQLRISLTGTAAAPITIRAAADGGAFVAGGIEISSSKHVIVEGFVTSPTFHILDSNDVIARRNTSIGTAANENVNVHVVLVGNSDRIVLEDTVSLGTGRYSQLVFDSQDVILRRSYAEWSSNSWGGSPKCAFGIYGSRRVTLENVIGRMAQPDSSNDNTPIFAGLLITASDANRFQAPTDITIRGSIFSDNFSGGMEFSGNAYNNLGSAKNVVRENCVFIDQTWRFAGGIWEQYNKLRGWGTCLASDNGTVTSSTFVRNQAAVWQWWSNSSVENSLFVDNERAFYSVYDAHSYSGFWGNTTINGTVGPTDVAADPRQDEARYGRGAYFFVPDDSPMKGAGRDGADIGAEVLYRYEDGVVTDQPLWPWPMEERVQADSERFLGTRRSVTWEEFGGYWKTLDGVYGAGINTPPDAPTGLRVIGN